MKRPFYIGYRPRAPREIARFVVVASSIFLAGTLVLAYILTTNQNPPADSHFEYGSIRTFSGHLTAEPYPTLLLPDKGEYLLVAPFKHGADSLTHDFSGRWVTVRGTLIRRAGISMIELDGPGAVDIDPDVASTDDPLADASESAKPNRDVGRHGTPRTLRGEIVDPKCWLGVMNPGSGTVHRACARLCIRGGIPPMMVYRGENDETAAALVTMPDGSRMDEAILRYVTRDVTIEGVFLPGVRGRLARISVDPAAIRIH